MSSPLPMAPARRKLLDAALTVIRTRGYAAATVDELCAAAGVAKGSFFHHFKDKEALAVAAAVHWSNVTGALFAHGAYHDAADPLDRVLRYIDFRKALIAGDLPEFTCLVGTMAQETYATSPAIRAACEASIRGHAATLEDDIAEAMRRHRPRGDFTAESLALHTQAVLQGGFVLAKATGDPSLAVESVAHLRRYVELLFDRQENPT